MPSNTFENISTKDRNDLWRLLDNGLKFTDAWNKLNDRWVETYHYTLRVQLIFDFVSQLIVPSGEGEGEPVILEDFEKSFIFDIYNPVDANNRRIVRRAILSLARKNGKSFLIAMLVLVHLIGPEAIINGEIYSAANTRDQAGLIFRYLAQLIRADPELSSLLKIVDSTKRVIAMSNGSVYAALSADAGPQHGRNPSLIIFDELAQAKNRDLYDALDTSMAARKEPLYISISTQSNDPQHILSQLIDDGLSGNDPTTVCHLYAVPDDAEDVFTNEELWRLANPALGKFRSLLEMQTAAKRAQRMPTFEASFRNLYLNQRSDAKSPLIPRQEWEACKGDATILLGDGLFMGLDLSGKLDLTALVGVSDGYEDRIKAWFWKPEGSLDEHERRDRVPYRVWKNQGFIETTPGRAIQYDWIAHRLQRIHKEYMIIGIAFDRYRIDDLMNAMNKIGLDSYVDGKDSPIAGAIRLVPWGQGFASMTQAVEAFEMSILDRKFVHDGNPVATWNVSNTMVVLDPAGNKKLDKSKSRFRIDFSVAVAMALGLKSRDRAAAPLVSAYESEAAECLTF